MSRLTPLAAFTLGGPGVSVTLLHDPDAPIPSHQEICTHSCCVGGTADKVTEVLTLKLAARPEWAGEDTRPRHHCHARGCGVDVSPRLLMCPAHWRKVPEHLRKRVWSTYVHGQEERKDPTRAYLDAADAAIDHVARLEGR